MPTKLQDKPHSIYDDENKPEGEGWYSEKKANPGEIADLEENFKADSAKPEDLPDGHPDKNSPSESGSVNTLTSSKPVKLTAKIKNLSKKKLLSGSIISIVVVTMVALFTFLLPIARLEAIFANVNQRAFTFAGAAVENRLGYLMERYMVSYTINLDSCRAARSVNCRAPIKSGGITAQMFNGWRDARIETKFMQNFNIQFESFDRSPDGSSRWRMIDSRTGQQIRVNSAGQLTGGPFEAGRRQFGKDMRLFLRNNTAWYQVMQRKSVRKYLARKHDVRLWCFLACQARDNYDRDIADAKTRWRYRFVDRFVYPFSAKMGLYLDCLSGSNPNRCSTENIRANGVDRSRLSDADAEKLINNLNSNQNQSLSRFLFSDLAEKYLARVGGQRVLNLIPIAGQIYLLAWVINTVDNLQTALDNGDLSRMAADINAAQYIEVYQGMRSDSDALKLGKLSVEEVGVLVESLEGGEQSLVLQAYNGTPDNQLKRNYGPNGYICQNGEPIQPGELVCEEKKVARTFAIEEIRQNWAVNLAANASFSLYQAIAKPVVQPILDGIEFLSDFIIGGFLNLAISAIEAAPGGAAAIAWLQEKGTAAITWAFEKIFPLPVTPDSPGREHMDAIHAGGEVAAMEYAKGGYTEDDKPYGLGGVELTEEQMVAILVDHYEQERFAFENESLFTRVVSLDYNNSLANQFFTDVPINGPGRTMQNIASLPFKSAFSVVGNIGSLFRKPVSAETWAERQAYLNPFGISRYGYPSGHPALTIDPESLTPEVCEGYRAARELAMTDEDVTGFESHAIADPCLLELSVIESGGALFMDENFNVDTLLDTGAN